MSRPLRVVVCGTLFGQVYLSAFNQPFAGFELAGIVARGSQRSRDLAEKYGVPLYQQVDDLPGDIDIACVVIRSAIVGGAGSEIAQALLQRGISVLQEHPVYQSDVAQCLKLARKHGCTYHVNTHYPHSPAVRRFIRVVQSALAEQKALFIDATCGVQVICSLLDILGRAFGRFAPCAFEAPDGWSQALRSQMQGTPPFSQLRGVIAGVPIVLNLQNQLDPADPDNHFHIMHRICVGLPGGNLLLANTHGPLLWHAQMHIPRERSETGCREPLPPEHAPHYYRTPLYALAEDNRDDLDGVLAEQWPSAVRHALREFATRMGDPQPQHAQQLLALTAAWKDLMSQVGNPQSVTFDAPPPLPAAAWAAFNQGKEQDDD
ncbi:Gfo/Idh/MocA family oxidoreductase [Pantoea coffeiphila]|uniref:Gfo/Idh/MocA family oxidoreductase n=1 Tax=Pantoea coffeiphila TaxID=1465635 RepID=UPI0019604CC5|nr:Gfo/Idh/MocA family oxidoreductase [Pantoea coffeiphila]MBM7342080.1 thiazolinyl imide reductase [Pantoea coffeiphila]